MPDLNDIVGQDEAISQLRRALTSNRMPHAYLFVGPEGVGRRTTARALAGVLLCQDNHPSDAKPAACGQCASCKMMAADTHPDFHLIYKELARYHDDAQVRTRVMQGLGIPVIRDFLIAPASLASSGGRGKVFLVRQAELMNAPAQNALLKTLEEPPAGVTIILLASRAEQMLPTTLSRCAIVRFGPLPREFVTRKLMEIGAPLRESTFWSAFTDGSVGLSLRLNQQEMYPVKCDIIDRLVSLPQTGSGELGEHLSKTTDRLAKAAVVAVKKTQGADLSRMLASRQAAGVMLQFIASAFGDAMHLACRCDGDTESADLVNADQAPAVAAIAARFTPIELAGIIEQLCEYERLLWRNVNPRGVWDNAAITCASGPAAVANW